MPIMFLPLILGIGLLLLVTAVGLWFFAAVVGSALGVLLHIIMALAFGLVMYQWILPAVKTRGFDIPKAQTPTFYLSLVIAFVFLYAAIPNTGLFSVVGSITLPVAGTVGIQDLISYALFWGAVLFGGGWILEKVKK